MSEKMRIETNIQSFKADLYTPISVFLRIRNEFRKPMLLEGNDYHSRTESTSVIGFDPLTEIIVTHEKITVVTGQHSEIIPFTITDDLDSILAEIMKQFQPENETGKYGFFSYFGFEYAHINEPQIETDHDEQKLPLAHFILYKYLIVIDHFHDTGEFIVNRNTDSDEAGLSLEEILRLQPNSVLPFELKGKEKSSLSDSDFRHLVGKAREHILRGDVFQLVVSREFNTPYFGDDFQVYRELRTLNPSPYLFYADFETHRIIGSSPEKQLQIRNGIAEIHPIAGTVRKSGDPDKDELAIQHLIHDDKENAEHTMLVDLARNDLSKYCNAVKVTKYKEIQHFSHVIHLVSKVIGIHSEESSLSVFAGTFPAGTLSGTPKPKALELINKYEAGKRDYYGGAIGFIDFKGNVNLAIIIRSILSKNNTLHYRAGAGVVLDSIPENELQEIDNKLGAVRIAIQKANTALETQICAL
jgi:anthranilate synthase component 1